MTQSNIVRYYEVPFVSKLTMYIGFINKYINLSASDLLYTDSGFINPAEHVYIKTVIYKPVYCLQIRCLVYNNQGTNIYKFTS